ncbi:polysaccharide deacetylase family protein [Weeksella virosa]|uniref:DUF7033 domain-containing protein n=1 Tax=Weeksella virosa (strain ATCC 43766 / DSM 16922 / JCM 21250 / CCUG 30538 / CDC 9751 / IAM 14551 / NBRC 16016 / NCTC 11634 / CL345/78) TaxID=865938 RepID=F0P2X4_WEEVC|nr:polysaccharide deacetylase family protein [Weeksella virosa]ADX67886.1 hypothetical protein Weevi_1177 [Weeksella virosa DSM 16922]MDK7674487.1 polysaccharide deacetylase family protein [Weeksella virosa]SUP54189.1 Uncharacterised protein [Weeksella virosa]VEH64487.1 Uncharacterised protein [Weeksella virosa]
MYDKLCIYTEKLSPRIEYVFDFFNQTFLGLELVFVHQKEEFLQAEAYKINFSEHTFSELFQLKKDSFLLDNHIDSAVKFSDLHEIGKVFYCLSRYEEYLLLHDRLDEHQRFLGSEVDYSKPIVDQILLKILEDLMAFYPSIRPIEKSFVQINTHDVDFAWKYKNHSLAKQIKTFLRGCFYGDFRSIKEQFFVLNNLQKDPYDQFDYLREIAEKYGHDSIFFWLLGDTSTYDHNLSWQNLAHQKLIKQQASWAKIGIHPSYLSNRNPEKIKEEIQRLSIVLNRKIICSRQHFIKLHLPQTYKNLLQYEVEEDYTMGFAHRVGFRAGTAQPFFWFDLSTNSITTLKIFPFVAMDVTLRNYMKLSPVEACQLLLEYREKVKTVNGYFITLFHQSNFTNEWEKWREVYERIQYD